MYQSSHMARNLISGRGVKHFMIAPMQGWHTHTHKSRNAHGYSFLMHNMCIWILSQVAQTRQTKSCVCATPLIRNFKCCSGEWKNQKKCCGWSTTVKCSKDQGCFYVHWNVNILETVFSQWRTKKYNREVTKHHSVDDCMIHGSVWCAYLVAETDVETRGNASATEMSSTKPTAVDWCRVLLELFLAKLVSQMEWVYIAIDMHSAASCGKQSCIRVY